MVDWGRIEELRDEIGAEDCAEIVVLFFCEVEQALERLNQPGTAAEREADLHFLKGSAANLGFTEFGDLCAEGELCAAKGADDQLRIGAIIDSYRASRRLYEARRA